MIDEARTRLRGATLPEGAVASRIRLLSEVASAHRAEHAGTRAPMAAWHVPGRIEVLGKHTDYAGGRSLVCAADRGFVLVATPRADTELRLLDVRDGSRVSLPIAVDASASGARWKTYPLTVARRVARNFAGPLAGADLAFASDLPIAAGMSSSSALMIAVFLALARVNGLEQRAAWTDNIRSPEDLAGYLATVENGLGFGTLEGHRGVGTFGGSEDHTAIVCGRAGMLSQYAFCPTRFERAVALPAGWEFAIAASGVLAEKTGAAREAYNRASLATTRVLAAWREATGRDNPTLAAACESCGDAINALRAVALAAGDGTFASDELVARLDQFHEESVVLVPAAADALAAGDVARFGQVVARSQAGAEHGLKNQVPETRALVEDALALGAPAASAFGAGFGGSVWALVRLGEAQGFCRVWHKAYAVRHPTSASRGAAFPIRPGPGVVELL